jgi:CheY-like chemotaxis protein
MEELIRRTVGPAIELKVELNAQAATCMVDSAQVENSLLNLCINARDALGEGGLISITTCNQQLDEKPGPDPEWVPGNYLAISVTDNGTGMSPEVLSRVFEPFFTTKEVGAGTGLGLSMVYGFIKQSGGQIQIQSEPGQGTCVCLLLPCHAAAPEVIDAPQEQASVEPAEAADSQAGLQLLRSDTPIDLLVTDIGLPGGMDGRQMASAGRAFRPDLPIVFMTGYAEPVGNGQARLDGSMAWMHKPFPLEALTSNVRALLGADLRFEPGSGPSVGPA